MSIVDLNSIVKKTKYKIEYKKKLYDLHSIIQFKE